MNTGSSLDPMALGVRSGAENRVYFYRSSAISAVIGIYDPDQLRSEFDSAVTLAANDNTSNADLEIDNSEWIGDIIDKLAAQVPPEEWDKLPRDMAARIDERLYGREP